MTSTSLFHLILLGCDMSFIHHANKASNAERQGRFAEAYQFWVEAVGRASKDANRHWAESRADYCLKLSGGRRVQVNSSTI